MELSRSLVQWVHLLGGSGRVEHTGWVRVQWNMLAGLGLGNLYFHLQILNELVAQNISPKQLSFQDLSKHLKPFGQEPCVPD